MAIIRAVLAGLFGLVLGQQALAQTPEYDWVVSIQNEVSPLQPAGASAGYVVTVVNDSLVGAPATTINIPVPPTTTFNGASGTITGCAEAAGIVSCTVPALGADASADLLISFLTSVEGVIFVTPNIPAPDADPANNSETVSTTIIRGADIDLQLTGTPTVPAGGGVSYTFTATNFGPYSSDSFTLDFPIPTGLGSVVAPPGCVLDAARYLCTVEEATPVGGTVEFTFTGVAAVGANSTITVVGSVEGVSPPDPNAANDTASFDTAVTAGSDVSVTKQRSPPGPLVVGDAVTFTLDPRYTGDVPTGLTLTDTIPSNYGIVTVTPAAGSGWVCSVSGQTITCTLPSGSVPGSNVPLGEVVVVTQALAAGAAVNSVTIASAGPFDPDLSNNTADDGGAVISPPFIDLAISKTGPRPPLVVVGNTYSYELGATNVGNTPYSGTVRIQDFVPAGLTANSIGGSGWICSPTLPPSLAGPVTLTCIRFYSPANPLPPKGSTPPLILSATVTQDGPIVNAATVSAIDGNLPDPNPGNDSTTSSVTGSVPDSSADVSILKTAQNPIVIAGEEQVYRIEIANSGPTAALDLVMVDQLTGLVNNATSGAGAGYVGIVISDGLAEGLTCSTETTGPQSVRQTCTITRLPVCVAGSTCPVVEITVRPGANGGPRNNSATVGSESTADPNLANNRSTVSFTVDPRADVTVSKAATPSPVPAGQNLVYVVTASNLANGLSAAENVTITDTLPANLTFLSAVPSSGSCSTTPAVNSVTGPSNDLVQCNVGTLSNDSQQTVRITVRPNQALFNTAITNSVDVSTTTVQTNTSNDSAAVTTPVTAPAYDLAVSKTDNVDPVSVGEDVVYTIIAENRGPSASENVVVTDTLPSDYLSFRSAVFPADAACTVNATVGVIGGDVICNFATLAAGQSRTILITLRGEAKGVAVNRVTIEADGSDLFDINPGNNTATQNTTVRTRADVAVTAKTPDRPTIALGENLTFTIRVENLTGPVLSEADQVVLSDTLPAGMVLTGPPVPSLVAGTASALACTGAAGGTTLSCNLGTLSSGGIVDVVVPVLVRTITASPQTLTNTASVTTTSLDVNPANNSNSGQVQVTASAIRGQVYRDFNDNGLFDANDTGIRSVRMTLTGTDLNGNAITRNVNTQSNGSFAFTLLPQGTYTLRQGPISELYLDPRPAIPGSSGGVSDSATRISEINLPGQTDATGYLFPKVPQARIGLAKAVTGTPTIAADGSFSLTFLFNLRNFSLEPLQSITVTDALAGASPLFGSHSASGPLPYGSYRVTGRGGSCGSLNAGFDGDADQTLVSGLTLASATTCTITLSLRVQPAVPLPPEITPGVQYLNQGTADGVGAWTGQTSATNPQLTDPSTNGTNPDPNGNGQGNEPGENEPTPVVVGFAPAITLVKTADTSAVGDPAVGDIITYAFTVTNSGNVTLADVSLSDPLPGIALTGGPIPVLAPGESDSTTFTATYALTQADLNARRVENQATATGTWATDGGGAPRTVSDLSGTDAGNNNPTVVDLGSVALVKSADAGGLSTPPVAGEEIVYAFTVTNTGLATLRNVTLSDPLPGLVLTGGPIASLAPGASDGTTFTARYAITQADIDAGLVANTATVTGDYADDGAGGTLQVSDSSSATSPLAQAPAIALVKSADAGGLSTPTRVGDVILYAFTVVNTGNMTLRDVTVSDPLPGLVLTGGPIASLAPGAVDSTTYTGRYTVTEADFGTARVENQAVATGNPPSGPPVSDLSGGTISDDAPTVVFLTVRPEVTASKAASVDRVIIGDSFSYTLEFVSASPGILRDVTVVDVLPEGLVYTPGTARISGVAVEPVVTGRTLRWPSLTIGSSGSLTVTLAVRVTGTAPLGALTNRTWLADEAQSRVSNVAEAVVQREPEHVFDCSDIIGKVFDDRNLNGYQDDGGTGEPGLAAVRLITPRGFIVTTDRFGRFHVPCAELPKQGGSNFTMKLDTRSLPTGYRMTTENPRTIRVTPGKMAKINFGAAMARVVRIDLSQAAFGAGDQPTAALRQGIAKLVTDLRVRPSVVRLNYQLSGETDAAARRRLDRVEAFLRKSWGRQDRLLIERTLQRSGDKK